mmetsp:Transcript_74183/g.217333  ORF Transcript_74183/g.217333 Transcript_74183/m.217333 type:complete len:243 (-) Transcript_74183:544-1272(-)
MTFRFSSPVLPIFAFVSITSTTRSSKWLPTASASDSSSLPSEAVKPEVNDRSLSDKSSLELCFLDRRRLVSGVSRLFRICSTPSSLLSEPRVITGAVIMLSTFRSVRGPFQKGDFAGSLVMSTTSTWSGFSIAILATCPTTPSPYGSQRPSAREEVGGAQISCFLSSTKKNVQRWQSSAVMICDSSSSATSVTDCAAEIRATTDATPSRRRSTSNMSIRDSRMLSMGLRTDWPKVSAATRSK